MDVGWVKRQRRAESAAELAIMSPQSNVTASVTSDRKNGAASERERKLKKRQARECCTRGTMQLKAASFAKRSTADRTRNPPFVFPLCAAQRRPAFASLSSRRLPLPSVNYTSPLSSLSPHVRSFQANVARAPPRHSYLLPSVRGHGGRPTADPPRRRRWQRPTSAQLAVRRGRACREYRRAAPRPQGGEVERMGITNWHRKCGIRCYAMLKWIELLRKK